MSIRWWRMFSGAEQCPPRLTPRSITPISANPIGSRPLVSAAAELHRVWRRLLDLSRPARAVMMPSMRGSARASMILRPYIWIASNSSLTFIVPI
jgi:hypothetical protein